MSAVQIDNHIEALRALGCAVVVLTDEDIHSCMDGEENGIPIEKAGAWLRRHRDEVEEALLGDYWSDTVRSLIEWHEGRELAGA